MARVRPRVVVFDVVETLMSLEPLRRRFEDVGLPGALLERWFDQVISVADVRSWKPPARVYRHALDRIGRPAGEAALVAVHAFDCHGARRVGLTTGWASRLEGHYATIFAPADVTGTDLLDVANGLLALPRI